MKGIAKFGVIAVGMAIATFVGNVESANAFTVHDGWNYSIDSFSDGSPYKVNGKSAYEVFGSAYQISGDTVTFAINSNMDINGVGDIEWGDILLNFTGDSLIQASNDKALYGIRFSEVNESGVAETGVYRNVSAKQVASNNRGYSSYDAYANYIDGKGGVAQIGDITDVDYFDTSTRLLNVIDTGEKAGEISMINNIDSLLGLDFAHFNAVGTHTLAFSFERSLLPYSDGIFHFGLECNNDVHGGDFTPVPTPAAVLPSLMGLIGAASRKKKEEEEA